jgi:hypothetical protein
MNTRTEAQAEAYRHKLLTRFEDPKTRRLWADRPARLRRLYLGLTLVLFSMAALTVLVLVQNPLVAFVASPTLFVLLLPQAKIFQFLEAGARTHYSYELVVDEHQRTEIDQARNIGHSVTTALLVLTVAITVAIHLPITFPLADPNVPLVPWPETFAWVPSCRAG